MDHRAEVREFLISRRAKISSPRQGCPWSAPAECSGHAEARSPLWAGVSVEYYAKLERGTIAGVSACIM